MLSRLKGIENPDLLPSLSPYHQLWICFPVWRELKRSASMDAITPFVLPTLDMLSRLKGIETFLCNPCVMFVFSFGYAFPFEGNWNSSLCPLPISISPLWICFPVWRELKHTTPPFECNVIIFGYAFPFEGNWNSSYPGSGVRSLLLWLWICFPVWRELKLRGNVCSVSHRVLLWICFPVLKGIETIIITVLSKFGESFGYAFPFEGNWNKPSFV